MGHLPLQKKYDKNVIRSYYKIDFTEEINQKGIKRNKKRKKPKDIGIFMVPKDKKQDFISTYNDYGYVLKLMK